jgi:hypothetical protein
VIDDDWPALADDKLSPRVGTLKNQLAKAVINLKPATTTQGKLVPNILADLDALSDYRVIRLDSALAQAPIYVPVIIFGFLVTMACFGSIDHICHSSRFTRYSSAWCCISFWQ